MCLRGRAVFHVEQIVWSSYEVWTPMRIGTHSLGQKTRASLNEESKWLNG